MVFTHNFLLPAIHGQTGALTVRVDRLWYTHNIPGTKSALSVIEYGFVRRESYTQQIQRNKFYVDST